VSETIKFENGLIQIALAFSFFEPVRAAMEMSQHLIQAIPVRGSPLLQLPGIDSTLASHLRMRKNNPIRTIQDLLRLDEKERRSALNSLDDEKFAQAVNISKQIPVLIVSNVHFKGVYSWCHN
jgi:preprotein translocase subunit Sec63